MHFAYRAFFNCEALYPEEDFFCTEQQTIEQDSYLA